LPEVRNLPPGESRDILVVDEVGARHGHVQTWPEARAKLVMTLVMWAASHAIFALGNLLAGADQLAMRNGVRVVTDLLGMALCFLLHCLLRSLSRRSFRTRAIALGFAGMVVGELYAWTVYFVSAWSRGKHPHFVIIDWDNAAAVLSLWTWFFMAWTGLYLAIEYGYDAREEARRAAELRTLAHNAKLRALSNQISPHFLFNSLNSISALILDGRREDAERMLTGLSTFFRSSLAIDPLLDLTVEREFELHRRYLTIEQMRYPDLEVEFVLPDEVGAAAVPALILQPLVENAVKHGVAKSLPPTSIVLSAARSDDRLILRVVNRGQSSEPRRTSRADGIGLANVRERLAEYYGDAGAMEITVGQTSYEVCIAIPLRYVP
jgi:hypothetical protein